MKFFTNEDKIAIVAIVGIVLLFFGLNFLKLLLQFVFYQYNERLGLIQVSICYQ